MEQIGEKWMAISAMFDIESSIYYSNAPENVNKVNDTLDVCNYRVIQNYAVNKVPMSTSGVASNESNSFDLSDPNGSRYFFDQSTTDNLEMVKMEDTLDVCYYRRQVDNNLSNILNDQESTLAYHDVITELKFNESTIKDEPNTSSVSQMMEDTLDVCYYRRKPAKESLTPIRYSPWMSSHFNKCHLPFTHFSPSPIPLTSSPAVNNSSFVAQFSDHSDDTTLNLSSE